MAKKDKNMDLQNNFIVLGIVSLIITPIAYAIVVLFFGTFFCSKVSANDCGFAGVGIGAYALYIAAVPFLISVASFVTSYVLYLKSNKNK